MAYKAFIKIKKSFAELESMQGKLIKSSLNLKKSCKNTPLLDAMKVPRIESTVKQQEILLLRAMLLSKSRSHKFYSFLLANHLRNQLTSDKNLLSRVVKTCNINGISFVNSLCNKQYIKRHTGPKFTENDGLIDSLRFLTSDLDNDARAMINALLSPF